MAKQTLKDKLSDQHLKNCGVSRKRRVRADTLIKFTGGELPLNLIEHDDKPWFVAHDVARHLEYFDAASMCRILDDDEYQTIKLNINKSNNTNTIIISESGLYHAIFLSRKPNAKAFRRWVTETVLPSIRRTGGYIEMGISQDLWFERTDVKANLKVHYEGDELRKALAVTNINPMTFEECYPSVVADIRAYRSRKRRFSEEYQRDLIVHGYIDAETLGWILYHNQWMRFPSECNSWNMICALVDRGIITSANDADVERDCPDGFLNSCGDVYVINKSYVKKGDRK